LIMRNSYRCGNDLEEGTENGETVPQYVWVYPGEDTDNF